jgi:hypothetical protein
MNRFIQTVQVMMYANAAGIIAGNLPGNVS